MDSILAKTCSDDELYNLWQAYFSERTIDRRNQLVHKYMFLANRIASYYYSKRIGGQTEFSDYLNLGVIGLIQAIEKYQDDGGAKFETFASYRIKGNILNSIKNFSEKNACISNESMRNADLVDSLVELSGPGKEQNIFEKILEATISLSYSAIMEATVRYDTNQHSSLSPLDGYHQCELNEIKKIITEIVSVLPKKQQVIIRYYYYYELSFVDISNLIGISKGRVSQIHREAIERVREIYQKIVNISQIY